MRAGWSLGSLQDRYIFGGAGGDQLVGRTVCGLPISDLRFSSLPPHLSSIYMENMERYGWENVIDRYHDYPDCFRRVIPYLFSSIVFHFDWLKANLHSNHPL